jgi:hypothetical protein
MVVDPILPLPFKIGNNIFYQAGELSVNVFNILLPISCQFLCQAQEIPEIPITTDWGRENRTLG